MKKYFVLTIALLVAGCFFTACDEKDPVELTFQDIYGREDWEVDAEGVPGGYFEVKKSTDVELTEQERPGQAYKSYKITTEGMSPSITTQRILAAMSGKVLTFKYKSSEDIVPTVILDPTNEGAVTKAYKMPKATEWTEYSFDLGVLISNAGWGGIGSYVKLQLGNKAGVDVEISDIQVRARNDKELLTENAYYFKFGKRKETFGQMASFEELATELKTNSAMNCYIFQANPGANDCNAQADIQSIELTADDNQLYFEYKCAKPWAIQIFWCTRGNGDQTNAYAIAAAEDWTAVHLDWEDVVRNQIFVTNPDAGAAGQIRRLDFEGDAPSTGTAIYIRGLRLEKKL